MSTSNKVLCARLANGCLMPAVGCGCWQLPNDDQGRTAMTAALDNGVLLIDDAQCYGNEEQLKLALDQWSGKSQWTAAGGSSPVGKFDHFEWVDKADFEKNLNSVPFTVEPVVKARTVWVTSKVWCAEYTYDKALAQFDAHIGRLGGRIPVDLMLMHWPHDPNQSENQDAKKQQEVREEVWKAFEEAYHLKKARAIGISNFSLTHLKQMEEFVEKRKSAGDPKAIMPMVLQVEISPLCALSEEVEKFCRKHKMALTAYSLFGGSGHKGVPVREQKQILDLASSKNKKAEQIIGRWALQKGYAIIPRSKNPEHIRTNYSIFDFELSDEEMKSVDSVDKQQRLCPNPNDYL